MRKHARLMKMLAFATLASLLGAPAYASDQGTSPEAVVCPKLGTYHDGNGSGQTLVIEVETQTCTSTPGVDGGPPVITETVRVPLPFCDEPDLATDPRPCIPDTGAELCPDGTRPLGRQYARTIVGAVVSEWRLTDLGGCPQPPELATLVTSAFTTATLTPTVAGRHPDGPEGLVNMPLVLSADPTPQTWTTTLAGWPVTITATPTTYTWDLGGAVETFTTTDPGAPYPNHTLAPVLPRLGTFPITLTTTFVGSYRVGTAGPFHPITGTAATTTPLDPITILEARTRLVADTL